MLELSVLTILIAQTHCHTESLTRPSTSGVPKLSNQVWQNAFGSGALLRNGGYGNPQRTSIPVTVHQRGRTTAPTIPSERNGVEDGTMGLGYGGFVGGGGGGGLAAPSVRQRRASIGATNSVAVTRLGGAASKSAVISAAQPPLPGMTRSEIFQAEAAVLTSRLQQELSLLAVRVSEDSPQHLHSIRQIDDMIQEVRRFSFLYMCAYTPSILYNPNSNGIRHLNLTP